MRGSGGGGGGGGAMQCISVPSVMNHSRYVGAGTITCSGAWCRKHVAQCSGACSAVQCSAVSEGGCGCGCTAQPGVVDHSRIMRCGGGITGLGGGGQWVGGQEGWGGAGSKAGRQASKHVTHFLNESTTFRMFDSFTPPHLKSSHVLSDLRARVAGGR